MTLRPLSALLSASLLAACTTPLEPDQIEVAHAGLELPQFFLLLSGFLTLGNETSCPSVTETATDVVTVSGGCTDDDGTAWAGTAVFDDTTSPATVTYTDFSQEDSDGGLAVDGTFTVDDTSNEAVADLVIDWGPGGGSAVFTYTDYTISDLDAFANALFNQEASYTVTGAMKLADIGDFEVNAQVAHTAVCEDEYDEATFTLHGDPVDDIVFTWDGLSDCDGCLQWDYNGDSDTICP